MNDPLVLDASAILAYVDDEPGADTVQKHLLAARADRLQIFACFVTLTEVRYITIQEKGEAAADCLVGLVKSWPMHWVHSDEQLCLLAARFKAHNSLSLADAFVAATAFRLQAAVMHKDPEFESVRSLVKLVPLPYKPSKKR